VYQNLEQRILRLQDETSASVISGRRIGLEKECLRVAGSGAISQRSHPLELGSALCNSEITTDFSEALLEMVTPPCDSSAAAQLHLSRLHQFIARRLPAEEHLWNTSMPCILHGENSIRIGEYGQSHQGLMKHVYRRGLGLRYGRRMQAIAGIHFNFSLPTTYWPIWLRLHNKKLPPAFGSAPQAAGYEPGTAGYFHMTQNLIRVGWVVPYLFGASPAICASFLDGKEDDSLDTYNESTRYGEFATSLRMSEIGYRYRQDSGLKIDVRHDTFGHYLADILGHVTAIHPAYQQQGLKDADEKYQQLNACRLQIENEYYSSVRPKQIPEAGELPLLALQRRGIRYLELRSVDVNVFEPTGVDNHQLHLLEMLMMFASLADTEPLLERCMQEIKANIQTVALQGRKPGITLQRNGQAIDLVTWGQEIMSALVPLAEWLDTGRSDNAYQESLALQAAKFTNSSLTPSARVLDSMQAHDSFFDFVLDRSLQHHDSFLASPLDSEFDAEHIAMAEQSLARQQALEAATQGRLRDYLDATFAQYGEGLLSEIAE